MWYYKSSDYSEITPGCDRCALIEDRRQMGLQLYSKRPATRSKQPLGSSRGYNYSSTITMGDCTSDMRSSSEILCDIFKHPLMLMRIAGCPVRLFKEDDGYDDFTDDEEGEDLNTWNGKVYWKAVRNDHLSAWLFIKCAVTHIFSVLRCMAFILYAISNFEISTAFYYIHFALFTLPGSFIFVTEVLATPRNFFRLSRELRSYVDRFGLLSNALNIRWHARLWTGFVVFVFTSTVVTWAVFYQVTDKKNPFFAYPWVDNNNIGDDSSTNDSSTGSGIEFDDFKAWFMGFTVGVSMLITGWPFIAHYVLYTVIVALLIQEYSRTRDLMEDVLRSPCDEGMEQRFFSLRERHVSLSRVVSRLSDQSAIFCGLVIVFDQVMIMLVVYAMARGPLLSERVLSETMSFVFSVASVVCVCGYWGKLNDVAHSISSDLCCVSWENMPPSVLQKIQAFVTDLSCTKVGIDVFGIYVIDSSTIIMILGSILTYALVILEFERNGHDTTICQFPGNLTISH